MASFMLPLGAFQVQLLEPNVVASAETLQKAMTEWRTCMDAAFGGHPDDIDTQAEALDRVIEGSILRRLEAASQEFKRCLETSEFPHVLPPITIQLIYASLVAQIFNLSFEIHDYEATEDENSRKYWWVSGRVVDGRRRAYECSGSSFTFDGQDERLAEGALLSACADAFVAGVYAAVPHFPWDRHFPWAGEPHIR